MAVMLDENILQAASFRSWQQRKLGARMGQLDALQRCMLLLLNDMTPRQKQVFLLHYRDGLTVTQVARELGVNKSTASRTLARVERKIRTAMKYVQ